MPAHRVDPGALLAAGRALAPLRNRVAGAEDDLLAAPMLAGDAGLQTDLDAWVDHVLDTLRAIGAEAAEQALTLRGVAVDGASTDDAVARSVAAADREGGR